MSETTHLVDHVIPAIPMRQWVLTVPQPLRYLLSYDTELCSVVIREHLRSVFAWLRHTAKRELGLASVSLAHPGADTALQRFNSAAALSVHIHTLVTDGVFVANEDGTSVAFHALPAPTHGEIASVAWSTCQRGVEHLRAEGRFTDVVENTDTLLHNEPGLAQCYSGSILGVLTLGPKAGTRVVRLFGQAADESPTKPKAAHGFDVHAGTRVSAGDKKGLERLCRYLLRPPLSQDRLTRLADGRVQLRLKRPWRDGTTHMIFEPLDFLGKLAALVPPPRVHLVRYAGVFAPNHKLRALVVLTKTAEETPACEHAPDVPSTLSTKRRQRWAQLMARVFDIDVRQCPTCGKGSMQTVAVITDPRVIRRILESVGMPADAPRPSPACLPVQAELEFSA